MTDDAARDRAPNFTPDGRSLLFYSNRGGAWEGWMIDVDGGNIRKVAQSDTAVIYPLLSPKGDAIVYMAESAKQGISMIAVGAPPGTAGTPLPGATVSGRYFSSSGWSPDGARLTGYLMSETGRPSGVGVYDFASQTTTMVSGDETFAVNWLADSRRVVYFTNRGGS